MTKKGDEGGGGRPWGGGRGRSDKEVESEAGVSGGGGGAEVVQVRGGAWAVSLAIFSDAP